MPLKTGKQPFVADRRDLKAEKYIDFERLAAATPAEFGHEDKMPQPRLMLGNGPDDSVRPGFQGAGCCVFSFIANAIRLAHGIAGTKVNITGKEVIAAYSAVTGYVIGDDSTDNGTEMRAALKWWQQTGFTDADGKVHKLGAYLLVSGKDLPTLYRGVYQLDVGLGLGIEFPGSAADQFHKHQPWEPVSGAQIEGGHAILLDAKRTNPKVETWAEDHEATESFLEEYVDETWAILLPEMLVEGKSPEGIDVAGLQSALKAL